MLVSETLHKKWNDLSHPFLVTSSSEIYFKDVLAFYRNIDFGFDLSSKVVVLIGDFNLSTIATLLYLLDQKAIIVPLTTETRESHEKYFQISQADFVIENEKIIKRAEQNSKNTLIHQLVLEKKAGIVLFTSGSTGEPKGILHNANNFLSKYLVERPSLRTAAFLLFDHIGGINTLLHTLFNKGTLFSLQTRDPVTTINICKANKVELLPTTPTFLRLLLFSGALEKVSLPDLKLITYGTEKMDQTTLTEICKALPYVDIRQTYGMSELGILSVKSLARDSLFIKIGGEGVETKVIDDILQIKTKTMMLGYLNNDQAIADHWFNTKDRVIEQNGYLQILGRENDLINIAGLKYSTKEVEDKILEIPGVINAKVIPRNNPITGNHFEAVIELANGTNITEKILKNELKMRIHKNAIPQKITFGEVEINYRFKKV